MTALQLDVALKVVAAWRATKAGHYRASRSGERVTLASLFRSGALARRAWRGIAGAADAAYEYRPSNELLTELARESGVSTTAAMMPPGGSDLQAIARRAGRVGRARP